jgi:hypothetical protein
MEAARLLREGVWQAEVARRLGVRRQSVGAWARKIRRGGVWALKAGRLGRPRKLHAERLMVLAAVTLLAPAVARIVLLFTHNPLPQFLAFYACILLCVTVDTLRHRRLHPAFAIGAMVVIVAFQLSFIIVQTPAWMKMVTAQFG